MEFFFFIIYKWNLILNLGIFNFEILIKKELNRLLDNVVFMLLYFYYYLFIKKYNNNKIDLVNLIYIECIYYIV